MQFILVLLWYKMEALLNRKRTSEDIYNFLKWTQKMYREGTKKTPKSSLTYLSDFLSHSVDFFSTIYSNIVRFFRPHFWGVQALVTLIFHAFFAFRPLKKGLKSPRGPQNWKFNHVKLTPKTWHYWYRLSYTRYFFAPKSVFRTHNSK